MKTSTVKAGSKELRALVRQLKPGLGIRSDGKAKVVVIVVATGEPLRYPDGRAVGMPNSPTGQTVTNLRSRLTKVGALR